MSELLTKAKAYAEEFLATMNHEKIQVSPEARDNLKGLDFDLQKEQIEPIKVIEELNSLVTL